MVTLKELAKLKGFTLSEISERTDISIAYLSKLNTGIKKNPSSEIVKKISTVLKVSTDEVIETIIN